MNYAAKVLKKTQKIANLTPFFAKSDTFSPVLCFFGKKNAIKLGSLNNSSYICKNI